jgi:serine/threonine protein kinase
MDCKRKYPRTSLTYDQLFTSITDICADQSARWRIGDRVQIEHYLAQCPELLSDPKCFLELIHLEIALRTKAGDSPSLSQYLRRFPQHAELLRGSWSQTQTTLTRVQLNVPSSRELDGAKKTIGEEARSSEFSLTLPGIELFEKLGEGGMGVVYRARDIRLDQPRAIKVIRSGPFASKESQDRFNREARAVARLNHPGVVRIHSLGEHHETLYICMEFVDGGSLQALLAKGPLEIPQAAELVRDMALAVHHAHVNRVLHRDLKPANVILSKDGRPKISDFGLAKLLDTDDELTQTGAVMGTPAYMAPEQADGRMADLDERTDVWSLGAILYECLTGAPPFKGVDRNETMELVRKHPPTHIRKLRPETPLPLEAICLQCLEKRIDRRYATAFDLAADLQSFRDGKPTQAGSTASLRGLRRRQIVIAGVLLACLTVAAVLYFLGDWLRPGIPDSKGATTLETANERLEPDQWHPLLTKIPTRLEWPAGATMEYKPSERELDISSCAGLGLNAFGETNAKRYRLRVNISQTPFTGNIGVFFGCRETKTDGGHKRVFQILEIRAKPDSQPAQKQLIWKTFELTFDSEGNVLGRIANDNGRHSRPLQISPSGNSLEIAIGPGRLEAVIWENVNLTEMRDGIENDPIPFDPTGQFGIYTNNSSGVFKNAQYFFHEEP